MKITSGKLRATAEKNYKEHFTTHGHLLLYFKKVGVQFSQWRGAFQLQRVLNAITCLGSYDERPAIAVRTKEVVWWKG